jgi:hypothetical protein
MACVYGRQNRLAVHHTSTLNDIKSQVALGEEESVRLMLYRDPLKSDGGV